MAYIAVRPSNFDRAYAIGELIPDNVVDPSTAESLIAMGRIVRDIKAVNAVIVRFLGPITGGDGDDFDYEAFRARYEEAMGRPDIDAASFAKLDQILQEKGKLTVGDAKGVFFNLPWVAVQFDVAEKAKTLTVSYTKDGEPGTFVKGNGSTSDSGKDVVTSEPVILPGSHVLSYVLGDGAIETDANLGLKGDAANGEYVFTILAVTENDETAKANASAAFAEGVVAAKASAAQKAQEAANDDGGVNTPADAENAAGEATAAPAKAKRAKAKT